MSKLTSNNNNDDQNTPRPSLVNLPVEQDEWLELENLSGGGQPKNKTALQRRQARSIALQTLFEGDATNHLPLEVLNRHLEIGGLNSDSITAQFARLLVNGVGEQRQKLDDMIALAAPNWPVDQMAKVDKNILRLAIFEILFNNDVPTRAAINEAIELAKSFGSDSSSRFVNGVLGAIVTQQLKEQPEAQD